MKKILAVDDDEAVLRYLERILTGKGFAVCATGDPFDVPRLVEAEAPDLLVLDVSMPGQDGISLFRDLKRSHRKLPVLFITAFHGSFNVASDSIHQLWTEFFSDGNVDILYKPFREEVLFNKVELLVGLPAR